MNPIHESENIESLRARITVLEEENNSLSQQSEDLFLISTLFDTIQKQTDRSQLFQSVLEKVSILKNIPFCAFLAREETKLLLISKYFLLDNLVTENSNVSIDKLDLNFSLYEPYFVPSEKLEIYQQQLSIDAKVFMCKEIVLIPFYTSMIGESFLLCATNETTDSLTKIISYLVYVVNRIAERFDNIFYQEETQRLNHELEGRIIERTNELLELNKQLKSEINERKKKEEIIKKNIEELTFINHLVNTISFTQSPDSICKIALDHLIETIPSDIVFIFTREKDALVLRHSRAKASVEKLISIPEHRVGECMCGLAVAENKALYSKNIFVDIRCTWEECKKIGFRSFAALPLRNEDEVIGVIGISSLEEYDYQSQSQYLETLAAEISVAFVRAKAHENLTLSETRMRVIIEGTPHLFFYTQDSHASITYISPTVKDITGYSVDQWLNQKHWFVTDSPLNNIAREKTYSHLKGDFIIEPVLVEINHADGYPILLEIYENPIFKDGEVIVPNSQIDQVSTLREEIDVWGSNFAKQGENSAQTDFLKLRFDEHNKQARDKDYITNRLIMRRRCQDEFAIQKPAHN